MNLEGFMRRDATKYLLGTAVVIDGTEIDMKIMASHNGNSGGFV